MPESGPRVVLLARAGAARDRVRSGLVEAGADLVLEADPTALEPPQLQEARPQLAMVVLDAFTEPAFDRLEPVLAELGAEVMLEEADVAAAREGWDAARWVRHLAAKLHRHADVLPPGAEPAAAEPAAIATPVVGAAFAMENDAASHAAASVFAGELSPVDLSDTGLSLDPALSAFDVAPDADADSASVIDACVDPGALDASFMDTGLLDPGMFDPALLDAAVPADAAPAVDGSLPGGVSFDPGLLDLDAAGDHASPVTGDDLVVLPFIAESAESTADAGGTYLSFDPVAAESPDAGDADTVVAFDFGLDEGFALAGEQAADAPPVFEPLAHGELDFAAAPGAPADLPAASWEQVAPAIAEAPAAGSTRFGALELALDDGPIVQAAAPAKSDLRHLEDLDRRIAALELVDDGAEAARSDRYGAVAVLAGIGGPDAVRQLLGALPAEFARPVLVQQRLDGARHDRLVAQMQRASALPVELATVDAPVRGGVVYIVPAGIGLARTDDGLRFDEAGDLLAALEPAGSAVVLLSGTELADAERLAAAEWSPALRAAQAPEGCYDATAPLALASRGGLSGQPAELARHLIERWSAA